MFTPEMKVAIVRGAYSAALHFAGMTLTTMSLGLGLSPALIAGGIAAVTALGWRSAEGEFDARRNRKSGE